MNNNHIIRRGSTYISGTSKKFVEPILIIPGTGTETWDDTQQSLFITTLKPHFEPYLYDIWGNVSEAPIFYGVTGLAKLRNNYYGAARNVTASVDGQSLEETWSNTDTEYYYKDLHYCTYSRTSNKAYIPYGAYWNNSEGIFEPKTRIANTLDKGYMFLLWTGNGWQEVENFPTQCYKSTLNYNNENTFKSARREGDLYYEGFWKNNLSATSGIANGGFYIIESYGYYIGICSSEIYARAGNVTQIHLAKKSEATGVKKGRINGIFVSYTE